jgi:acyl-CoA reductase-like NAD-dependent aldehyde dehydrogenase
MTTDTLLTPVEVWSAKINSSGWKKPDRVTAEVTGKAILARQREAFLRQGAPTPAKRRADLSKLKTAILARRKDYETAINADFGHRPAHETAIMEVMPTVQGIDYLRKNLPRWMR